MTLEDLSHLEDSSLVKLTLQDSDNFVFLIKRYQEKLSRYIIHLTGVDSAEAEDILQEALIKTYLYLNDFDQTLKFSSWIYRITHNQAIDFLRKKQNYGLNFSDLEDKKIFEVVDFASDPKAETDKSLLREKIHQALKKIKLKYREVLILRYFEDKSYDEISDILRIPSGTVATLINRAKKQLKQNLEV